MSVTKEQINSAIKSLGNLNLRSCTYEEVRVHTDVLLKPGFLGAKFPENYLPIYRGRVVQPDNVFHEVSRISYPPKVEGLTRTYNRLSTNVHQVFYGALMPQIERLDQITAMIEVGASTRDESGEFEEYIQIGKWSVRNGFNLAIVGIHSGLAEMNESTKFKRKIHDEQVKALGDRGQLIEAVAEFMSHEFSKKVSDDNKWEYKISAAYGDGIFDAGMHAIQFPSIKSEGQCFNIALHSDLVDSSLTIEVAAITRIRKFGKEIFIDWFLQSPSVTDGRFHWEEPSSTAVTGPYEMKLIKENMQRNGGDFINPEN